MTQNKYTRRRFLKNTLGGTVASSCLVGTLGSLAATRALAADDDDYRALVCVFLLGGNDAFNMVVPRSTTAYDQYADARQTLAIDKNALLPINPIVSDGADYGLHPAMPEIQGLFESGDIAIAANVGALVAPTNRNDFINSTVPLAPNLFSHNSQQNFWQSVEAFGVQNYGWAGRIADILTDTNTGAILPMNISLSGANLLQAGQTTNAYSSSDQGAPSWSGFGNTARRATVESVFGNAQPHMFAQAYADTMRRSLLFSDSLRASLEATAAPVTVFGEDSLSLNLKAVAHMIAARNELSMQRQIFYVGLGGWDTHDAQLTRHTDLLAILSKGLSAFQQEMVRIGCHESVTTFTASDFGRTLTSNGDGSDHGWGSHQLVMGGAVDGQKIHGTMPEIIIDGPQDSGRGRIIPTASVDQYGATLAKWFGVADGDLDEIYPNLANFDDRDLGLFL